MVGASRWCLWTDWSPLWVEGEPHTGWAQRDIQVDRTGSAGPDLGESCHVPAIRSCKHLFWLQALELFRALSAHDLIYPQQSSKSEGISRNPALGRFQRPRSVAGIEPIPTVMLLGLLSRDRRTEQSGWEQCGQGGTPAQMEACSFRSGVAGRGRASIHWQWQAAHPYGAPAVTAPVLINLPNCGDASPVGWALLSPHSAGMVNEGRPGGWE